MLHEWKLEVEFFEQLTAWDAEVAARLARAGCPHCEGPLHRGYYQRKPRGGLLAGAGESCTVRHSLCCGRRGCRRRVLPPSFRFLGRRVYLEFVVLLASVIAQLTAVLRQAAQATGVPRPTLRRWGSWWRTTLPSLPTWAELRPSFVPPPPDEATLPKSLWERLELDAAAEHNRCEVAAADVTRLAARLLAPLTTASVRNVPRLLRGIGATAPPG
jgi:hypothetical protein